MNIRGRLDQLSRWWSQLTTAWRVNVLLYGVAGILLVALVAQLSSGSGGDDVRRLEVVGPAGVQSTTTVPSTTTTTLPPPATAVVPSTLAAPSSGGVAAPVPTTKGAKPGPPAVKFNPPAGETTTAPPNCRNSTDPRCGPFRWDPSPGGNRRMQIDVTGPVSAQAGQPVIFTVHVTDPDHVVTNNCARADFGDQMVDDSTYPCHPAQCPDAHGAWTPPPPLPGDNTFTFVHTYTTAGTYAVAFTVRDDQDRCPDPYGNNQTVVMPPLPVVAAP